MAQEKVHFQGLPARICWLGYGERNLAGLRFNELVARGEVQAPIVLGRDHLDCGSVASPYRETEAMADGSDAIADWPLLNALVNTASGATWVSIHHGGGVGIGRSIHAGQVCVADGTPLAGEKLERVLTNDPGMGVIRHVDAGYEEAAEVAAAAGRARPDAAVMASSGACVRPAEPGVRGPLGVAAADRAGPGHRRVPPVLLDPGRPGLPGLVRGRGPGPAAAHRTRTATATSGPGGTSPASGPGAAVATGSHLDSVPDGGAYDGPLGVVSAFAAIDELRAERLHPVPARSRWPRSAEEEGARFGVACLGSRLLTGAIDPGQARELRDGDGITLAEAMQAAGQDPGQIGRDEDLLAQLGCYVELHVEQGRGLADLDAALGIAEGIWPHGRWRLDFAGQADHAGTAALADRRDPMIPYAATVLAAREAAVEHGARATIGKVTAEPGAANACRSAVRAWLDVRAPDGRTLEDTVDQILAVAGQESEREPGRDDVPARSRSARRSSSTRRWRTGWRRRWRPAASRRRSLPTAAGHDAGVLAARLPTAMLFVRNPTGVSHSPAEHADDADCAAGVTALAAVLRDLAG